MLFFFPLIPFFGASLSCSRSSRGGHLLLRHPPRPHLLKNPTRYNPLQKRYESVPCRSPGSGDCQNEKRPTAVTSSDLGTFELKAEGGDGAQRVTRTDIGGVQNACFTFWLPLVARERRPKPTDTPWPETPSPSPRSSFSRSSPRPRLRTLRSVTAAKTPQQTRRPVRTGAASIPISRNASGFATLTHTSVEGIKSLITHV